MKGIVVIALCLSATGIFGQTKTVRGNQFELTGTIINKVELTPDCGVIAFATVIEMEIEKFSKGDYASKTIGIIFTCPELYGRDFFEVGKVYNIQVADENQADFGWTIVNEALLEKYALDKKLWAVHADRIK